MKTLCLSFMLLTVSTLHTFAQQSKEVKNEAVPKAVQDAFHTESMSETPKKWEVRTLKNGEVRYVASYTDANFNARLVIKSNGDKLTRTYTGMDNGSFNNACDEAALKQYPGYAIKSHEMVFYFAGNKRVYRNILEKDGKRAVTLCDESGKPLKMATLAEEN